MCSWGLCLAQSPQDFIKEDPLKAAGSFYAYDVSQAPAVTPAPEGYQPFYISHFARHGARYCTSEYETLYGFLTKADQAGMLADGGKDFLSRYEKFFQKVKLCKGNLTGVGKAQHRGIAQHMFERFPQVFEGPTHVEAVSTESARVIMSMWSCLSRLVALDPDLDVNADASAMYCSWLQPSLSANPYMLKDAFKCGKEVDDAAAAYFEKTVPCEQIALRFFTSMDVFKNVLKTTPEKFISSLYAIVTNTRCLDADQGCFDDVFSPEELQKIWMGDCVSYFLHMARFEGSKHRAVDYAAFTLGQIISSADADIASGKTQLRLRFGHDSALAPLFVILDVNGFGKTATSFEQAQEIFPSYNLPMGANLQLVFFKNASGDILVKALVNEAEAALPLPAVSGPYYKWSDFKAYYLPLVRETKRAIKTADDLAALKAIDWGWKAVGNSKVEAASATIDAFGGKQTVSMVRFPMKAHAVSVLSSPGEKAAATSSLGTANKALAAINGSFFDKDNQPITFLKDEGRVVCSKTSGDAALFNGMFRIKDKKGRSVDIALIDTLTTSSTAKGWREAIVSGPVLLESGKTLFYENDGSRTFRRFYQRRHPRTLVGYTLDGMVYFIVVDGRFPLADGMNVSEMQTFCESLGLYEALNLDGGGSATLWTSDFGVLNHPYDNQRFDHEGERSVPNALIVK